MPKKKSLHKPGQIPRTINAAIKLGFKPVNLSFTKLDNDIQNNFVRLSDQGARKGHICGHALSDDGTYTIVSYTDPVSGECNRFFHVPIGDPIPSER